MDYITIYMKVTNMHKIKRFFNRIKLRIQRRKFYNAVNKMLNPTEHIVFKSLCNLTENYIINGARQIDIPLDAEYNYHIYAKNLNESSINLESIYALDLKYPIGVMSVTTTDFSYKDEKEYNKIKELFTEYLNYFDLDGLYKICTKKANDKQYITVYIIISEITYISHAIQFGVHRIIERAITIIFSIVFNKYKSYVESTNVE